VQVYVCIFGHQVIVCLAVQGCFSPRIVFDLLKAGSRTLIFPLSNILLGGDSLKLMKIKKQHEMNELLFEIDVELSQSWSFARDSANFVTPVSVILLTLI